MGEGKPLEEGTRNWAESWFGRNLADVRLHDSHQAAEIAARLGAEAFAVQGHVIGAADRLTPTTSRGRGLLAHEITHVIQHAEPPEAPSSAGPALGPLLDDEVPPVHGRKSHSAQGFRGLPAGSTQRAPLSTGHLDPSGSHRAGRVYLQVNQEVLQRDAEEEATASEQTVARATDRQEEVDISDSDDTNRVDPQEVAARVYRLMMQELVVDRDRAATTTWTRKR